MITFLSYKKRGKQGKYEYRVLLIKMRHDVVRIVCDLQDFGVASEDRCHSWLEWS